MSLPTVLLPLFVEVALTFVLWFWMAYYRATLTRRGDVRASDIALREPNWPVHVRKINNAAHNQLETPVLFYVLTILVIVTRHADVIFVVLAWVYVVARLAHAYIHVTSNDVSVRGPVFGISLTVLCIMWVIFAFRILAGLP